MYKLLVACVLVAGCDDVTPPGAHQLYQLTREHMPTSPASAMGYALGLENRLGGGFSLLTREMLGDPQAGVDEAVAAHQVDVVLDLQRGGADSYITTFVGSADVYDPTSASEPLAGNWDYPFVTAKGGDLPIVIAPFGVALPTVLHGAAVKVFVGPDDLEAFVAGGLDPALVRGPVLTAWQAQVTAIFARDCTLMPPACGCAPGSPGEAIVRYLDAEDDCAVSVDELAQNPFVSQFLEPDVTVDGTKYISFGFGVDADFIRVEY